MKKSLIVAAFLITTTGIAQACPKYEALISASISEIQQIDENNCVAYVDDFSYYHPHSFCALSRSTILKEGISLQGEQCARQAGEVIDGVVVDDGETIYLD